MSKLATAIEVDLPRESALAACRAAILSIDWELVDGDADLSGRQDPPRLCCRSAPVTVEIAATEVGERRTALELLGTVPGFGPIASRDLRAAMALLRGAIVRRAGSALRSPLRTTTDSSVVP